MTEKEIKEYVTEIRHKADIFHKSGFATTGITNAFDKSADIIEELLPYMAIDTVEEFKALKDKSVADNMLIDGLIKFCDEKSKNIKLKAEPQVFVEIKQALEELKAYKSDDFTQDLLNMGYTKGIKDGCTKAFEYIEQRGISLLESGKLTSEMAMGVSLILGIAKAGAKNE